MMTENILDRAKAAAGSVAQNITNLRQNFWDDEKSEIVNQFKEKAEGKVQEVAEILNEYSALFKEAGYEINSLNASLSIPPDISLTFLFLGSKKEEEREMIILAAEKSKLASIILKSLFKASDYAESTKFGEMKLKEINITLGLIPGISVTIS